jgi:hypothetical protein
MKEIPTDTNTMKEIMATQGIRQAYANANQEELCFVSPPIRAELQSSTDSAMLSLSDNLTPSAREAHSRACQYSGQILTFLEKRMIIGPSEEKTEIRNTLVDLSTSRKSTTVDLGRLNRCHFKSQLDDSRTERKQLFHHVQSHNREFILQRVVILGRMNGLIQGVSYPMGLHRRV